MPPKRQKPPRNQRPVQVTTKTTTRKAPPVSPAAPRHVGEHAVTTNQEPFASWPDAWPPVTLPQSNDHAGFATVDEEPNPETPALQTNGMLMDTAQFNDYDSGPDLGSYGYDSAAEADNTDEGTEDISGD